MMCVIYSESVHCSHCLFLWVTLTVVLVCVVVFQLLCIMMAVGDLCIHVCSVCV